MRFVVLDLTFDCVLGVPWLTMTNPRLDWVKHTLAVYVALVLVVALVFLD